MIKREHIPKEIREDIYHKYGGKCGYCGCELEKSWNVDHIHPVAAGGNNDILNLMPACRICNQYKTSFSLEQFRSELQEQVYRARKYSLNFRLCEKFGLIEIKEKPIVFYFESFEKFDPRLIPHLTEFKDDVEE